MARFDVYENPDTATRGEVPYLVDLQAPMLNGLSTRIVAPLFTEKAFGTPSSRINPVFVIGRRRVVMSTAELAGIPASRLGPHAGSLAVHSAEILAALDLLFSGY